MLYSDSGRSYFPVNVLLSLCVEAKTILENAPGIEATRLVCTANRFLREQSKREMTSLDIKGKANKEITSDSLQSIHDEDVTYRKKRKGWSK